MKGAGGGALHGESEAVIAQQAVEMTVHWMPDVAFEGKPTDMPLVHVEVALQDPLLEGIRALWLWWNLADWWLHDGDALGALVHGWAGPAG